MKQTGAQKLAKVVKLLIIITFLCNLIILPLVPGLVGIRTEGAWEELLGLTPYEAPMELPLRAAVAFLMVCWQYLFRVWRESYTAVLTAFLWVCGACTAVILRQAWKVLDTVIAGEPFQAANGRSMRRAARCFFAIAEAALVRLVLQMAQYGRFTPYNALFIPVFTVGGLLCLVMSALFCQAAELKQENDLTI